MGCRTLFFLLAFLTASLAVLGEDTVSASEPVVSGDSATVFWNHVEDCDGYCEEYAVFLLEASDPSVTSSTKGAVTNANSYTFENLEANKEYIAKVYGMSSARINETKYQDIKFTTKPSGAAAAPTPDDSSSSAVQHDEGVCKQGMAYRYYAICVPTPVRNMEAYKTSHNKVSVKWTKPEKINGGWLTGFQVYRQNAGGGGISSRFQSASPCPEFSDPDVYCHTYEGLKPGTEYTFYVVAKNAFSRLYSEATYLNVKTKSEPDLDEPTNLQVVNLTSTSFDLSWSLPEKSNKLPSTFLITVTETERFDKENCCKVYPQLEVPVTKEQTSYTAQMTGLSPAANYEVKVRSKSGYSLGEPEIRFVQTRPPKMGLEGETLIVKVPVGNFRLMYQRPGSNDTQKYKSLIRTPKMLAVLTTETIPADKSGLKDAGLYEFIKSTLQTSFFVIKDLVNEKDIKSYIQFEAEGTYKGEWGENTWKLNNGTDCYRLALLQVSKYKETYGLDHRSNSEAFQPRVLSTPFSYGKTDLECFETYGHI